MVYLSNKLEMKEHDWSLLYLLKIKISSVSIDVLKLLILGQDHLDFDNYYETFYLLIATKQLLIRIYVTVDIYDSS